MSIGGLTGVFKQHFLYFLPLPQGQASLRPIFFMAMFKALGEEAKQHTQHFA